MSNHNIFFSFFDSQCHVGNLFGKKASNVCSLGVGLDVSKLGCLLGTF
jgi:hypothetical protein